MHQAKIARRLEEGQKFFEGNNFDVQQQYQQWLVDNSASIKNGTISNLHRKTTRTGTTVRILVRYQQKLIQIQ